MVFSFSFWLCLRRCRFLQLGDPTGPSLGACNSLGNQKHVCALAKPGQEIPQIHGAVRARVLPKSRAPSDGAEDPFTTTPDLWDPLAAGGEHKHLDPARRRLPERRHPPCLTPSKHALLNHAPFWVTGVCRAIKMSPLSSDTCRIHGVEAAGSKRAGTSFRRRCGRHTRTCLQNELSHYFISIPSGIYRLSQTLELLH